jgi:hypothetical protein
MNAAYVGLCPEWIHDEAIPYLLERISTICRRAGCSATAGHVQTAGIGIAPACRHAASKSL